MVRMWQKCGRDVVVVWWRCGGDVVRIWCISLIGSLQITIDITISCVEIHYKYQPKKYHKFSVIFTIIMKKTEPIFIVYLYHTNTTIIRDVQSKGGISKKGVRYNSKPPYQHLMLPVNGPRIPGQMPMHEKGLVRVHICPRSPRRTCWRNWLVRGEWQRQVMCTNALPTILGESGILMQRLL
jgi:hypothetical protein